MPKPHRSLSPLLIACFACAGCANTMLEKTSEGSAGADAEIEFVQRSDIEWGPLNPARGDQSPRAGKLWGDRTTEDASGFLVQFVEGFSSPPHIHNVTYRGVVLEGLVHNDDPDASEMWLPAGSYWTQPAGLVHITAAKSAVNLAYIEISSGPYLVLPTDEAFADQQAPINVDASNVMWLDASDLVWIDHPEDAGGASPQVAFLWSGESDDQPSGYLLKLPAGYTGTLSSPNTSLRAVVIQGQVEHAHPGTGATTQFEQGSYFGAGTPARHHLATGNQACTLYIRTAGHFDLVSKEQ